MKRPILAALTALTLFSPLAFASPAQDLFDQAGFYLSFNYNGFSSSNAEQLVDKYQIQLDRACSLKREQCEYSVAETLIEAMLEELGDQHSYYISARDAGGFAASPGGDSGSAQQITMGILPAPFTNSNGLAVRVVELLEGSPAEQAGVQRLDAITAINGQRFPSASSAARSFYQAADSGDSPVRLTIDRAGKTVEVTVKPRLTDLSLFDLPFMNVVAGVARIRVAEFTGYNQIAPKLHLLVKKAQGLGVKAIVVDLRDNPGGTATECLAGVSAFVPDVTRVRETRRERFMDIYAAGRVYFRNDTTGKEDTYYTIPSPTKWTGKLSVLVNKESASCAEYFASDVQAAKRGSVIGERTYGLGNTGTRPFELINGGLIAVTLLKSLFPNGTPYPERVNPDFFVRDNFENLLLRGTDDIYNRALQELGV